MNSQVRIGGASTVVTLKDGDSWIFYNVANDLRVTQVGITESAKYVLPLEGFIHDIDLVEDPVTAGVYYALVSMGDKGITVVNVTDPANMTVVTSVDVNYEQTDVTFADGGGNILTGNIISGSAGSITSLAVYNDAGGVNQLIVADEDYGLHKTKLANLFDTVAGREADGTLLIESEIYTLQYAGEGPWGGPKSLTLYRNPNIVDDKGMLFVAMGFLGIGIFDPENLDQVGRYNLYLDPVSTEDWFVNADGSTVDVTTLVQSDTTGLFLDSFTGMPDYRQASFEITEAWKNSVAAPTPWAEFDRYGKYYYNARKVDVATFNGNTYAYIAYALGGLVAVDVTGYDSAGPYDPSNTTDPFASFIDEGDNIYLGYAPAVPANGPDVSTGATSESLYPHFGSGMLKEAGIVDVHVDASIPAGRVFFSDHFAGMVAISNASDPSTWHGPGPLPYNNDIIWESDGTPTDQSPLGDHWPDYEFVTSYDMKPYDLADNESLPTWLYESPALLVTGEVSGHGNSFALMPTLDVATSGQVDVIMTSGGGGISFIDITDNFAQPTDDGFAVLVHMSTTDEIFREADGSLSTDGLSIGHSAGVASYNNMLFLADGPHGMTIWEIADPERCIPTDNPHLMANTLQDEYPVTVGTETIYPTPHAYEVVLDVNRQNAFVLSQSRGLRRVSLADLAIEEAPVLLKPLLSDIYEHNTDSGSVGGLRMQDHAYDVELDGTLAFVADGSNGLSVYDLSKDPSAVTDYVVGNLGGRTQL